MSKIIKKIVAIIILLTAVIGLSLFVFLGKNFDVGYNDKGNIDLPIVDEGIVDNSPDIITKTPYAELHFPGRWREKVSIENSSQDPYTLDYYGIVNDKKYHLFSLVFGESDGYCLGTFTIGEEATNMYIIEGELGDISNLSEEEQTELYDMQINVNYIIRKLEEYSNFKIS